MQTRDEQTLRDNVTAVSTFRALCDMVLSLPRAVGIKSRQDANDCMEVLKAKMDDLEDVAGVPKFSDMFNEPDKGNRLRVAIGPGQSMSGGKDGAEKFVNDYSKDTQPGNSITQAYTAMAEELANQGKRVESVEKAVSAIAQLLGQAMKGDAAKEMFSSEPFDDDDSDKSDDKNENTADGDATEKGGKLQINSVAGVPGLMAYLMNASKSTGRTGLAMPPNLAVHKSRQSLESIVDSANPSELARGEIAGIQSAIAASGAGSDFARGELSRRIARCSDESRGLLRQAGLL